MDAWVTIAKRRDLPLPAGFVEDGVGVADAKIAHDLADYWGGKVSAEEALSLKCEEFRSRDGSQFPLVAGVIPFLEQLMSLGLPMALATSSSIKDIAPIFAANDLYRFFPHIFTIESVRRAKPDPEIYLLARNAIGMEDRMQSVFVFEDSLPGATSARLAGAKVIGLGTSHLEDELAPLHGYIVDYADSAGILSLLGLSRG